MPPTYADFIVFHPALVTTDLAEQAKISRILAQQSRNFPILAWENDQVLADQALMLFVCHLLTLERMRTTQESSDVQGSVRAIDIEDKARVEYYQNRAELEGDPWDLLILTSCGRELDSLDSSVFRPTAMVVGFGGSSGPAS